MMYMYYDPWLSSVQDSALLRDIVKSIDGQYSAIHCYQQLASLAPTHKQRKQIEEIREDEVRHFHTFSNIYQSVTGKQHKPKIIEECPQTYSAGLQFAIEDEQETVDFYLSIAERIQNETMKHAYQRAAADEQNHAVWFLYFYTQHCCQQ